MNRYPFSDADYVNIGGYWHLVKSAEPQAQAVTHCGIDYTDGEWPWANTHSVNSETALIEDTVLHPLCRTCHA